MSDTHFLNVDLDVYSKSDLQPIVDAFGETAHALFVGRKRGAYSAHLEITGRSKSADFTIGVFCALIRSLPKAERDLWNSAKVRSFSIGIQSGSKPFPYDIAVRAETIRAVAELDADIVMSVYPARTGSEQTVVLEGWGPENGPISKVSLTKAIRVATGKGLAVAKAYTDTVVAGKDVFSSAVERLGGRVRFGHLGGEIVSSPRTSRASRTLSAIN